MTGDEDISQPKIKGRMVWGKGRFLGSRVVATATATATATAAAIAYWYFDLALIGAQSSFCS